MPLGIKEKIKEQDIVLLISKPENYSKLILNLLNFFLVKMKLFGVYVTINKPFDSLRTWLEKNGIDVDKLFFIDAVTRTVSEKSMLTEKCLFISSPTNLTDLSISLTQILENPKPEKKFILIDSLSTLLVYNSSETVLQFVHFISSRIRMTRILGVFLCLEEEKSKKVISSLSQFCDKVIVWKKKKS